ncbi:galactose-3-O-sulfotransferase 2-like [Octopus vulgaris]|uniref:Galactose-3-O-sulfotransferase 2-like n=1 Tax=Octopus vulgaris TaxID=6645 RepID=A0AA36FI68_OCTVU|nr:galactose-3-O-sulfotransferase 2-like [Octopus vulgaris]
MLAETTIRIHPKYGAPLSLLVDELIKYFKVIDSTSTFEISSRPYCVPYEECSERETERAYFRSITCRKRSHQIEMILLFFLFLTNDTNVKDNNEKVSDMQISSKIFVYHPIDIHVFSANFICVLLYQYVFSHTPPIRNVWRNEYLLAVPGEHFIGEYLKNPVKYESLLKNQGFSYTNNRMSYDLGLKLSDFHSEAKISKHISDLDKDFHLVLIQEYFDISMILLKRKLCWQMKDMLYIERNVASSRNTPILTAEDTNRFKKWAKADYILYEHYLKVFWHKIRTEEDILSEVYHYQSLLYQTKKFCMTKNSLVLEIQASVWNKEILLLRKDCDIMLKSELDLVYALQRAYREKLNL